MAMGDLTTIRHLCTVSQKTLNLVPTVKYFNSDIKSVLLYRYKTCRMTTTLTNKLQTLIDTCSQ